MNKKAAAGAAAAVLAASVAVNQAFEPAELVRSAEELARHTETAQFRLSGEEPLAQLPEYERISLADAARGWFIRQPVALKGVVLLPLWCIGALPVALGTALSPLWGTLLGLLLQICILLGLFCLVYKLLFPKRKLRELFRRKNLKWLVLGAVTVTAANVLLTHLWTGWPILRSVLLAAVGFGVTCLLYKRLCGAFKAPEPEIVKTRLVMEN